MSSDCDNDVDSLFEKYSIKQIEEHLHLTRNEIEKKKEELRIMVGERYRDLIEAADTIAEMQHSAQAIVINIQTMEGLCESLQQRGLIGFKTRVGQSLTQTYPDINKPPGNSHQYSVVVQVKLLVDAPEILWGLTEKKEFLAASQLLLLSQHAFTVMNLSSDANEILERFPIITRQWANIEQFKSIIVRGCNNFIKRDLYDYQEVLESVASIMFIENCSIHQALTKVLNLRKNFLDSLLSVKPSEVSRMQLGQFATSLITSLKIINFIFSGFDGDGICRLESKINEISGLKSETDHSKPISLLNESSLTLSFLPKSVVEFRPKLRCNYKTMEEKQVEEEVNLWLISIISNSSPSIKQLLGFTTSIKNLSLTRNSIWEIQVSNNKDELWDQVLTKLIGKTSFSPWHSAIKVHVLERAQEIIHKEINDAKNILLQLASDLAQEIKSNQRICIEEGDISDFVWGEASSDIPDQVGLTASKNLKNSTEKSGLFYKSRGYTKRIQIICRTISAKLNYLLDDLRHYAPASLIEATQKGFFINEHFEDETTMEDYNKLLQFLQSETVKIFNQSLTGLNNLAHEHSKEEENDSFQWDDLSQIQKSNPDSTVIVAISRLCHAFSIVCPHLKICSGATLLGNAETARRVMLGVQPDTQSWIELRDNFVAVSTTLMSRFLTAITRSITRNMKQDFISHAMECNAEDVLMILSSWESIPIEEEGEGGQVVHSSISVPVHPSPALTQVLTRVCSSINCICAHTITRISQLELVNQLCLQIVVIYESIEPSLENLNQTMALQLIFDLKLIQTILLTRDNKDCGVRITMLIRKLESRVDVFDLNVFHPHLASRVKVAACRLQVLLGIILPKEKQLIFTRGSQISSSGNLSLPIVPSVEIPRFSNVPVPISISNRNKTLGPDSSVDMLLATSQSKTSVKVDEVDSHSRSSVLPESTLSASRSAAALLSSWFGGSS